MKRLRFVLSTPLKYGANEIAELEDPNMPRYVRITDIEENDSLRDETYKSLPEEIASEYLLREGDILFARSGATAGKTFLYKVIGEDVLMLATLFAGRKVRLSHTG